MEYTAFEKLIETSTAYLRACNDKNHRFFQIGSYDRYEYDLFRNEIWWSASDGPKVRAKVTIVGSLSKRSNTWLWAWANPHFQDVVTSLIERVRLFGERESIVKLTEEKWEADEVDAWEMASVSARLLEAQGAYRSPGDSVSLFLLYDRLEFIPQGEIESYLPLKRQGQEIGADPNLP